LTHPIVRITDTHAEVTLRARTVLIGTAALVLAACGGGDGGEDGSAAGGGANGELTPITVGVIPILDVAPIHLGVQEGIFEEHGLDVTLENAQGGAAIVPAVVSEQYQFGFSNNTSLLLAQGEGLDLLSVAPGSSSTNEDRNDFAGVVVQPDSGIEQAADLAGTSIAINTLNNISDTVVREAVRQDGGDPSNIEFVELAFPDMPAAVLDGQVDAAFVVEPFLSISISEGLRDVASAYALAAENLSVATYFTSAQYAAAEPEIADRFTEAMVESQQYATENPDAVREIITSYTEIDQDLVPELTLPAFPDSINVESVQTLADLALTDGLLSDEADATELIRQ